MGVVRWGIVGCGDVTEVKSGPALRLARGSSVVAVMRRDGAKAADYARRHGVPRWYDDGAKLIADPEVDAVYVATPPNAHELYALMACAARKPCYVEKPMARNTAEAQRMVDAFAAAKLPLYVAYYRRGFARFQTAKELVETGALGTIERVTYRRTNDGQRTRQEPCPWRVSAEVAGAGLFLDLASHALDVLDFIFGPLRNVQGKAWNQSRQYVVEDSASMSFVAGDRAAGIATWAFDQAHGVDEYMIEGSAGQLRMSCFGSEPLEWTRNDGTLEKLDRPNPKHVQQGLIQLMVDELNGVSPAGSTPSTGTTALRTQRVMDTVLEDYYQGREDGFWHRFNEPPLTPPPHTL